MPDQTDLFTSLYRSTAKLQKFRIEFDGGTPCNIPRLGYGDGYGSYQIQDCESGTLHPIVRVDFGVPMSANVAEISTLKKWLDSILLRNPFWKFMVILRLR